MMVSRGAVALCALITSLLAVDGYAASTEDAPPPTGTATEAAPPPSAPAAAPEAQPLLVQPLPAQPPAAAPPAALPPVAPAAKAPSVDAAKGNVDGATYAVRLRDLEARVDELKEQIRRSHTRLSLLSDTILSGGVGGARTSIRFQNDMSGAFRLTRALFVLDGAVQYNKQDDTGALAGQKEIPIFKGSITPGDHTLQVLLRLRGHGYGVFSYLRGYQFEVKQTHSFSVTEGKEVDLDVIAWEKGGVTTPLEQRPAVRYLEKLRDVSLAAPTSLESEPAPPAAAGEDK
ncbi:MAG: hypothetical protein ABI895_05970 [Deltaproteobacteria bacterium]